MIDKIGNIKYKTQVIKQLDAFINGGSTTANMASLSDYQSQALEYLSGQGICKLDKPDEKSDFFKTLDPNDKVGRYRLVKGEFFTAQRLSGHFKAELKKLLGG